MFDLTTIQLRNEQAMIHRVVKTPSEWQMANVIRHIKGKAELNREHPVKTLDELSKK